MNPALDRALAEVPTLAASHLLVSIAAIAIATIIGVPLAIWAVGNQRAGTPVLATVALIQTIPALALLALFYPLLLVLGQASNLAIPALGFLPALLALTLYALLPIVRNGVAALKGLDPAIIEAANGVGMTARQRLRLVELPLAAPVLLAGIRTASVWTIGAATLATTVGQASLGDLIFSGLQTEDWYRVLVGCLASAGLALAADAALALIEQGVARRSPGRWKLGLALLATGLAVALLPLSKKVPSSPVITIGAKNFSEQYILAHVIARRLEAAGYRTQIRSGLGSAVAYRALAAGDIDVYVDYSGTLWANVLGREDNPPPAQMIAALTRDLRARDRVTLLGPLGFENAYAFAMRRDRAKSLGVVSLEDLARQAPALALGSDLEFLSRPEWTSAARAYRLEFRTRTSFNPTFMYRAIADGSVDAISAFSSDGRLAALDLVTLSDPKRALPAYDAVLLLSKTRADESKFAQALRPLLGSIPIDRMRQANLMVDRDEDKATPEVAAEWLVNTP